MPDGLEVTLPFPPPTRFRVTVSAYRVVLARKATLAVRFAVIESVQVVEPAGSAAQSPPQAPMM